jgi:16S rRNA (guanine527-N7)-methyltransferase
LTDDLASRIAVIAEAVGLSPGEAQLHAIAEHAVLLQRWNATYNLTAVRTVDEMLTQHVADCLAALPPLQRHLSTGRLLDVGSGGGLPGVLIAILMPKVNVTCVDAVGKKAAFIRQAAGALRLPNLHVLHARVETLTAGVFDVITARAFASLTDLCHATRRHLADDGAWMAMKGKRPATELAALPATVDVFHVEPIQVPGLAAERCLVWMRARDTTNG